MVAAPARRVRPCDAAPPRPRTIRAPLLARVAVDRRAGRARREKSTRVAPPAVYRRRCVRPDARRAARFQTPPAEASENKIFNDSNDRCSVRL